MQEDTVMAETEASLNSKINSAESRNRKLRPVRNHMRTTYNNMEDDKEDFKTMYKKIDDVGDFVPQWKGSLRTQFDTDIDDLYETAKDDKNKVIDQFHDDVNNRYWSIQTEIDKNEGDILYWTNKLAELWENLTNG